MVAQSYALSFIHIRNYFCTLAMSFYFLICCKTCFVFMGRTIAWIEPFSSEGHALPALTYFQSVVEMCVPCTHCGLCTMFSVCLNFQRVDESPCHLFGSDTVISLFTCFWFKEVEEYVPFLHLHCFSSNFNYVTGQ